MLLLAFPLLLLIVSVFNLCLISMCLGEFLLEFILYGTLCAFWTWMTISLAILDNLSTIISSKFFSYPFFSSSSSVQFSSVTQSCPTLCDPMNRSTPGLPVHHHLPEFTQTHVHRVSDAIQPSHPLSSSSPPAPNPSQHQSLFQGVNSSHEVAKGLELQL